MHLRPGEAVEHFVIVSLLGEGAMGRVYAARDTRLHRNVALKVVRFGVDAKQLLREARAVAALDHRNVVTVYEVGDLRRAEDAVASGFIAMELVKGRPLRAIIGDGKVPIATRTQWLADIARALGAAHRAGLVHRDVKPENVMVRDDGVLKVLDFGIAKRSSTAADEAQAPLSFTAADALASMTGNGTGNSSVVGTPYYMAPEQMRGEQVDGRADQFAWAVVAYELLTGAPPWGRGLGVIALVTGVLSDEPPPLDALCPEAPPALVAVVARAIAKDPADRFATMDELLAALEGAPVEPTAARAMRRARASRRIAVAAGGLLASAMALAAVPALRASRRDVPSNVTPSPERERACGTDGVRDVTRDPHHCGACDHDCLGGTCEAGKCQPVVLVDHRAGCLDLASDDKSLYFTENNTGGVYKVSKGGGEVTTLKAPDNVQNGVWFLTTDGVNVYWTDRTDSYIGYVSVDGGAPGKLAVDSPDAAPYGIATDGAFVYWTDFHSGAVRRTRIAGPHPGAIETVGSGTTPTGIASSQGTLVWAELHGYLHKSAPDGSAAAPLTSSASSVRDNGTRFVATDGTNVFWTMSDGHDVWTVPLAGGPVLPVTSGEAGEAEPWGIAVDASGVYWVDKSPPTDPSIAATANAVRRARFEGGAWSVVTLAKAQGNPSSLVVDRDAIYWTNFGSGQIVRLAK